MKLTIGMIVKNEEEYLERCLDGLKPILENVDSELIIVDTGSTDRTVEIAKTYTDKVYYFEWIDDFAAARNLTLEKAKGEWYMFVDGDEIFTSCNELIAFFSSGEYKKYTSASFVIKNIMSPYADGSDLTYDTFNAPRLTKIQPGTRFIGSVHERLNTYFPPYKILNDTVDHYGYLYKSKEEMQEKMKRNSDLLLDSIERQGSDAEPMLYLRTYESLVNTEPIKANEYLEKGIEKSKEKKSTVLIALYCDKARYHISHGNYENALQTCNDYFEMDKNIRPYPLRADAEIYAAKAVSLFCIEQYEKATGVFVEFFEIYKQIQSGKLNTFDSFLVTYSIATERYYIVLLRDFIVSCINAKKYNIADFYLQNLPIYKYYNDNEDSASLISLIVDILDHFDYKNTSKYYKQLDAAGKQRLIETLLKDVFISEKKKQIIDALRSLSKHNESLKEKTGILSRFFHNDKIPESELYVLSKKYCINDNPEIVYIAVKQKDDITGLFESPDFDMKLTVYRCYMRINGFAEAMENYSADAIKDHNKYQDAIHFLELCMSMIPVYRSPRTGEKTDLRIENLFYIYSQIGSNYLKECKTEYNELVPEIKAAVIAGEIINAHNAKKYKDCFAAMKKAIVEYEPSTTFIDQYRKIVSDELENASKESATSEKERLGNMIKNNIRNYIANGNISAATKTLNDYKQINPQDNEIDTLMKMIGNSKQINRNK